MPFPSRAALLALAENDVVKSALAQNGLSKGIVQRFVAGETLDDALATAKQLGERGIGTAFDLLGENVQTKREAQAATDAYIHVLDAAVATGIKEPYISVKLTALGLDISDELAAQNLDCILVAASSFHHAFVRVDMEGSAYTQRTLDITQAAFAEFGNVGTVLQSYLKRTDDDLALLLSEGIRVRLVKGAYAEPPAAAYADKSEVDAAYRRQMRQLLLRGVRPAIATHDEAILHDAKRFVREHHVANDAFEFQLLLGIRRDLQEWLAEEGYHVRAYVPFGPAWYPYFMRRLAERPANVGFILRNWVK